MGNCFRKIRETDLETIMNWRMRPDITKFMYTDPVLTLEDQKRWFRKISAQSDSFYWVVELDGMAAGLVNLLEWDSSAKLVRSGGYIAEHSVRTLQNIRDVNMNLYDYAFNVLGAEKATFEIMDNNISQVQWMKRIGAKVVGIDEKAICKNDVFYDLYLMELTKSDWEKVAAKCKFVKYEIE